MTNDENVNPAVVASTEAARSGKNDSGRPSLAVGELVFTRPESSLRSVELSLEWGRAPAHPDFDWEADDRHRLGPLGGHFGPPDTLG